MKLVSWNVNGIRAVHKKGLFVPMVQKLKPDIICLQETKAEQGQSEVDLPEYEEYWNSSKGRKGYSGTAIFTKVKPLAVLYDFPEKIVKKYKLADAYGDPNQEGRVIAAEFKDFYVVTCYTPNAKPDLSRLSLRHKGWDPAFLAYMKHLEEKKPVIFCGDLNVAHTEDDFAKPKENEGEHGFTKEERKGLDLVVEAGFVDTFRLFTKGNGIYTWWSNFSNARGRNIGWRIDYFFVSKKLAPKVKEASVYMDIMGSDHCPISLEMGI
jgi:exodeoxyribonuclease-3